jgi:LacI family transcriptional regulator
MIRGKPTPRPTRSAPAQAAEEPPSSRSRLRDVADAAGVSTATADRALHGRSGVRDATMQRVLKAAARLEYLPEAELFRALRPAPMDLVFLLPAGSNRYLRMLGDYIGYAQESLAPFNVRCSRRLVDSFDPKSVASALLRHGRQAQGLAFMALEHPLVREAVNTLAERGVHVVTLISDLSNSRRAAYVGMDNRAAGRTAGDLIGRLLGPRRGRVAMIAGSLSYRGHEEREMGFLHVMQERFPELAVVGLREGQDDADNNYRQARGLLEAHADLVGLYNIGGASDGVARALKEAGREQQVVFIGHGLTPDTRALLVDGTLDAVITQHPQTMVMNCARIFSNLRDGRDAVSGVEPVRISVVMRENLP